MTNPEHFLSEYPPWYPRVSTVRAGRYYSLLRQPKAPPPPLPPALFPSLLARITGVKPLSYHGQTFPSRPYASHCETSPQFSVRHVVWERTYFSQTIIFAFSTHYPSPLFTDEPITLSLRVSSMISPSLHRQGWPVLLSFKATHSPYPLPISAGQDHWSEASLVPWPDISISSIRLTL